MVASFVEVALPLLRGVCLARAGFEERNLLMKEIVRKVVSVAALVFAVQSTDAITLNIDALAGSSGAGLRLNGANVAIPAGLGGGTAIGAFSFENDLAGYSFQVVDGAFEETDSGGLRGAISSKFFIKSPITASGTVQSAPVAGSGVISFENGFTGTISFDRITTDTSNRNGSILSGVLNLFPTASGAGSADLVLLASEAGSASISFSILKSVTQITANTYNQRIAFDGILANNAVPTPDGGATAVLLGLGILGAACLRRKLS